MFVGVERIEEGVKMFDFFLKLDSFLGQVFCHPTNGTARNRQVLDDITVWVVSTRSIPQDVVRTFEPHKVNVLAVFFDIERPP